MRPPLNKIVGVDFETYYDKDFSLTNKLLNTSDYIRDPRFKVHCVSIKMGAEPAYWYDAVAGEKKLRSIDWTTHALLAHNTAFDGFILSTLYNIIPYFYLDTLCMARAFHNEHTRAKLDIIAKYYGVGEKIVGALENTKGKVDLTPDELEALGNYCANDTELLWRVFRRQYRTFPDKELLLIDLFMRMFCDPVMGVDIPRVTKYMDEEVAERERLITESGVDEAILASNQKFAAALESLHAENFEMPTKINKMGDTAFAFAQSDPEFTDLLEHEDIRVVRLVRGRLAAKSTIAETRAQRFINAGRDGQRLPILLNYYAAKTGRPGGGNKMNPMNLPRGSELRKSIIAPAGHKLVVCDSAQIELRVNNWLAGGEKKLDIIRAYDAGTGPDPYRLLASSVFSTDVEQVNSDQRFVGKVGELGLGYQMGAKKLQTTLALGIMGPPVDTTLEFCLGVVGTYRRTNLPIKNQWDNLRNVLLNMVLKKDGTYRNLLDYEPGSIWLPNGLALHYPALMLEDGSNFTYSSHSARRKIYGGLLTENIIQALARIIVTDQMLMLKDKYRIANMTYDEIVCCVPDKQAETCLEDMMAAMRTPPPWAPDLPLNAEGAYADYYSK